MVSIKIFSFITLVLTSTNALNTSKPNNKFNSIYVFGDSVSDFGNIFELSNKTNPNPKYYPYKKYSNGPIWVENLATNLNITKVKSFAYAGATSDNVQFKCKSAI